MCVPAGIGPLPPRHRPTGFPASPGTGADSRRPDRLTSALLAGMSSEAFSDPSKATVFGAQRTGISSMRPRMKGRTHCNLFRDLQNVGNGSQESQRNRKFYRPGSAERRSAGAYFATRSANATADNHLLDPSFEPVEAIGVPPHQVSAGKPGFGSRAISYHLPSAGSSAFWAAKAG